ncbi:MAG: phage terminase small subunit P27 family [Desulfobacteraceae bacterium]|nr:MAG: phage terminase small subunit P27 family [Desulfobacteraceae bacterium]
MKKPPKHLKADGRSLWRRLLAEFEIEDSHGLALLQSACEALDRQKEAAAEIERHGLLITNPSTGAVKANPAATIERDARASMLHALRALNLDTEDVEKPFARPGRPPGR